MRSESLDEHEADELAKHLVGGLTLGEMVQDGFDLAKYTQISLLGAAAKR